MLRRLAPSLAALVVSVTLGCATVAPSPHVELPRAPAADEPFDARASYLKDHALQSRESDHVFLHGGTRVYWPEDLLPAVDASSPTAKAIQEHVEARERVEAFDWINYGTNGLGFVGGAAMLGGLGAMFIPIASDDPSVEDLGWGLTLTGLVGGGALMGGALVVAMVHGFIVGEDAQAANEAADRAVRTYPQSLSDRLGVGIDANGRIVDYAEPGNAPPPPPTADDGREI